MMLLTRVLIEHWSHLLNLFPCQKIESSKWCWWKATDEYERKINRNWIASVPIWLWIGFRDESTRQQQWQRLAEKSIKKYQQIISRESQNFVCVVDTLKILFSLPSNETESCDLRKTWVDQPNIHRTIVCFSHGNCNATEWIRWKYFHKCQSRLCYLVRPNLKINRDRSNECCNEQQIQTLTCSCERCFDFFVVFD